jgi:hypothetical protein
MRGTGLGLIVTAALLALAELWISHGAVPPDSFTGPANTYSLAAMMAVGGLATILFGWGPHPVEDEPESRLLHLVG